ncbi:MAG: hypothetical protein J2P25_08315 [Nocardiopsaceae bacterium]|nr:hypothetical protein [Nocardiopsaceae bacterium]
MAVSPEHEALHRVFLNDEQLFSRAVFRVLGIKLPADKMTELNVDLTEIRPVERRADSVLRAEFVPGGADGDFILLIESQTEQEDTRRMSWPYYVAYLHDKYKVDVVLIVVCRKLATARWAREPIRIGRPDAICMTVTPLVLGPDNVPLLTTAEEAAADPHFAVFAALTHGHGRGKRVILEALAAALGTIDEGKAEDLAEFTEVGLGDSPGAEIWRKLMATETFPYMSKTRAKAMAEGHAQGVAEGKAEDILRILKKRHVSVDKASRELIEGCTDLKTLETWLDRSLDVEEVAELFADDEQ